MLSELDLCFSQSAGWAHSAWAQAYEHRQCYVQVQNTRYQQEDDEEVEEQLHTCWTIPLTLPCASDREQRAISTWSFLTGALGWVSGSDSCCDRAAGVADPGGISGQVSTDTKPSPRQSRVHTCACELPNDRIRRWQFGKALHEENRNPWNC